MSFAFTPTATELTTITNLNDGVDLRNAASVNVATQQLANAIAFEKARVDALADLTALAAITTPANGLVRHVIGFGWYVFQTSATTGLSPFRVAAADATAGGWLSSTAHESTRNITVPLIPQGISTNGAGTIVQATPSLTAVSYGPPAAAHVIASEQGFYPLIVYTGATASYGWWVNLSPYMVDGSSLTFVTLCFRPISGHAGLPTRQPQFGVVRKNTTGYNTASESLYSGNFVQLAAGSTGAYQADQSLVWTADQNNVIDRANYAYGLVIFDEGGTNALVGNRFGQAILSFTAIPDARRS